MVDAPYQDPRAAGCPRASRRARRGGRLGLAALAAWGGLCLSGLSAAAPPDNPRDEYRVKAAFLYNFGRYVEWPKESFAHDSDPFVIGVCGTDPFGELLDAIALNKRIQERRIVVRRFSSPDDYRQPCQLLFVSRSLSNEQQKALLRKTAGNPVFVVGESPGLGERGAEANFITEGNRIRFELNAGNARQAQLCLDAKLLTLGKPVGARRADGPR